MTITISCYALHPLAARFVTVWRYAQVASDCVVFFLSFLCCQCGNLPGVPLENRSNADSAASSTAFQIMPGELRVDPDHPTAGAEYRRPTQHPEAGDYRPDGELWEIIDVYSNVPTDPPEMPPSSRARRVSAAPEDVYPTVHKN